MQNIFYGLGLILRSGNLPSAWGHGEDRPGPHGGVIRMPGAFHTELKIRSERSFDLYLLDMEWKNPTVENSSVKAVLKRSKSPEKEIPCQLKAPAFRCQLEKGMKLKAGDEIAVIATRQGMTGGVALYPHPFLPPQATDTKKSHQPRLKRVSPMANSDPEEHQHHGH